MKRLLRLSVSLRTLLLFYAFLKSSHAECDTGQCSGIKVTTTTTTIDFPGLNCNFTINNQSYEQPPITELTPGTVHQVFLRCRNCCKEITTQPGVVRNLSVTGTTTSSVSLNWTEPEGNSSFYRVEWTDGGVSGNQAVNETYINVTGLTAGVQYTFTVTAVAGDRQTDGRNETVSKYTKPGTIGAPTVSHNTSSISLNWTKPAGEVFKYRVEWHNGGETMTKTTSETSAVLTGLIPGTRYTVRVIAIAHDDQTEGDPYIFQAITNPEVVRNLNVTGTTTSSVSLNWTKPVGNSSSYRVEWTDGGVSGNQAVNETYINVTGLTAGVQYTFTVTAVAEDEETLGRVETISLYTNPEVVRNLNVTGTTTSSVSLSWTEPVGNSSFYRVEWTDGGVSVTQAVNETYINVTGLTAGVQYEIKVTAVAGDGHTEGQSVTVFKYTNPEVVGNLDVTGTTTSSVSLNWTKPEGNSFFYRVEWTDGRQNDSQNVKETHLNVTGLTAGVQYTFTVTAVAGDNQTESKKAEISHYTNPEVVGNLSVTGTTTSSVSLNWAKPEGNSSSYRVEWTDGRVSVNQAVNETYMNVTGLTAGVQYEIKVTAVAGDGHTEGQSVTVFKYTNPEVVGNLDVIGTTTSSVSLNWAKPEGNSSFYRVEWTNGIQNDSQNVKETYLNVTGLIAGVQYTFTVTAVAGDNKTESKKAEISRYTNPSTIGEPAVSQNTSSISLDWTKPAGEVFKYRVEWHNGGATMKQTTSETFAVLTGLIPGTSYTVQIIAIAHDDQTEGDPYIFQAITKPDVVKDLTITNITTSSVSLRWTEPDGNSTSYKVQWTAGGEPVSNVTNETFITITGLQAGYQYNITVAAVAGSITNEGERIQKNTFTRPEKPGNIVSTANDTSSLSFSWTLPSGRVDQYVVNIWNQDLMFLNNSTTYDMSATFSDLSPGRIYNITVTAVAGQFNNASDQSSLATAPTPPGAISVTQPTNSSLHVQWGPPVSMEGAPGFSYHVTYQGDGLGMQSTDVATNHTTLSLLQSGTSYSIMVETVGPQHLRSTLTRTSEYTLPNPVLNVRASPESTDSLKVEWSEPLGAQVYYTYRVQTGNAAETVNTTSHVVTGLEPGTRYNVSVTAVAAPGAESTEEQASNFTRPKAVTNLTVEDLNTTAIRLTWARQSDYKPGYSYLVTLHTGATEARSISTTAETSTLINLTPGRIYTFKVFTVVGGVRSAEESTSSHTKPGAVSDISAVGTTTTMTVNWTAAAGQVDFYSVLLSRDGQLVKNSTDLSNDTLSVWFEGLNPGVLYRVEVVTQSGPFSDSSFTENATFPNPPGPIAVESQTVDSINISWAAPEHMEPGQYNFTVLGPDGEDLIGQNWFLVERLQSGTVYTISVVTVGALSYRSTAVTTQNYTRPLSVVQLRQGGITTDAVMLLWDQPERKPDFTYLVQTSSSQPPVLPVELHNTTQATINGLQSGSNYTFTVTTRTPDGTAAAPVTVSYFTRPYNISSLEADTLNTTSINLTWTKPLDYKNGYSYRIKSADCASYNKTVEEEQAVMTELLPGTNCTFYVFVQAEDGIEGEPYRTSQYTYPELVYPRISSEGSNASILVRWTAPAGNVEEYVVDLNSTAEDPRSERLDSNARSFLFENLLAGREYTATVTTRSGPFTALSGFTSNATFPNPPGPIEVVSQTTSSIEIKWEEAPLMANASFQYIASSTLSQGAPHTTSTTNTSHTFTSLLSGSSYNIYVATEGPMGLRSEKVWKNMVTTRPKRVQSLKIDGTEEESVTLTWHEPDEYKESYRYFLTWADAAGRVSNSTADREELKISALVPGSSYNFSVTTETADRTQGAPVLISACTNASSAANFVCVAPNGTEAKFLLSWDKPRGLSSGFRINVTNVMDDSRMSLIETSCNPNCNRTVSQLKYHTRYQLTLETNSCGKPSYPVFLNCTTGITNPLIPDNYESLVMVTEEQHNQFQIQIKSALLVSTNGPVTHFGVLVTNNAEGIDGDLKQFLSKTYEDWSAKNSPAYLATLKENTLQSRSTDDYLTLTVGDASKWKGYTNGALKANELYRYALVIFTQLNLNPNGLVNTETSLVSVTVFSDGIKLPQNPAVIGIAVGATLGIFCVLFIITIGFIIYWRRLANKESSEIQIHSLRSKVSMAVRVEDYEAYYRKQKADSNCGFAEEFEDLKLVGTAQAKLSALALENKPKNRYNNVLPYDSSRVKLSIHGSPFDDYINANYIPGYNSRKEFIAAQGPLPVTVNEFWRMIWEKNVQTLVMLTRCNEQGRVKCERYWPSDTKHFGNITVTTTSEIPLEDWTIRDFDIKNVKTAETRAVRHFHFTAWPDHGVPETTELLINFRHLVREHMDQYSRHSPTVVHCSAGVGRTGTFIAIDRLIFQIERESTVDVYGIIHDLRMHRPLMVQTEDQYVFLNQCAMDIIRSRTGTNVDLIYQNTAALTIYENVEPRKGYHNA
ncbi:receptor-type tyrosine-protein phosphatase eta-like isoform X2 [Myripristis murdjan]|uniref:receptor-type tyrosine-protein phosphatase eta-like isoform X2 n=1 Tax=Myripristis murdjan TaxID=586833 RepID=UPI001175CE8A|nr:receptor-type tyrosine-protein phosphatase eta-like isoform X2 [Myripristis murdjan]